MKLIISGGKEKISVNLIDRDVKLSKQIMKKFLRVIKERAEEHKAPSFFYTFLIVAYVMVNDYIKNASPEALALILNAAYEESERGKNREA